MKASTIAGAITSKPLLVLLHLRRRLSLPTSTPSSPPSSRLHSSLSLIPDLSSASDRRSCSPSMKASIKSALLIVVNDHHGFLFGSLPSSSFIFSGTVPLIQLDHRSLRTNRTARDSRLQNSCVRSNGKQHRHMDMYLYLLGGLQERALTESSSNNFMMEHHMYDSNCSFFFNC